MHAHAVVTFTSLREAPTRRPRELVIKITLPHAVKSVSELDLGEVAGTVKLCYVHRPDVVVSMQHKIKVLAGRHCHLLHLCLCAHGLQQG